MGAIEAPPALLGHVEQLKRHLETLVHEPAPLVVRSRSRTASNADSTNLMVRRCFECSGRENKERSEPRLLAVSEATALGYSAAKRDLAASHSAPSRRLQEVDRSQQIREASCGLIIRWLIWCLDFHVASTIRTYER